MFVFGNKIPFFTRKRVRVDSDCHPLHTRNPVANALTICLPIRDVRTFGRELSVALILQLDIPGLEVGQIQWDNGFIETPAFATFL
jgi:hypothetical protein